MYLYPKHSQEHSCTEYVLVHTVLYSDYSIVCTNAALCYSMYAQDMLQIHLVCTGIYWEDQGSLTEGVCPGHSGHNPGHASAPCIQYMYILSLYQYVPCT
jgi:hypothetical protein